MNKNLKSLLTLILGFIGGGAVGYFAAYGLGSQLGSRNPTNLEMILLAVVVVLAFVLHLIIHEVGHLVFGYLTGYKFLSFRVFNFIIDKNDHGKLEFKLGSGVAGTAGQCLMIPPKFENGTFPYKLYLVGGVVFNLIFSAIAWFIYPSFYTLLFVTVGVILAITNIIPLGFNDGMNLKLCMKSEVNRYACHLGLVANSYHMIGKSYVVEHPEVLEEIQNLKIEEENFVTDYLDFMEIEYNQDKFKLAEVYDGLLKIFYGKPDLILPYKIEVMKSLVMFTSLFEPEEPALNELLADKSVQSALKGKNTDAKLTLAVYEWRVNNNHQAALELLEEAKKYLAKSRTLYSRKINDIYIEYFESIIAEELVQE